MKVKVKKLHPEAVIPKYSKTGDAGLDLTAISVDSDEVGNLVYKTGLAFEVPEGYVGLLFPRSSNSKKDLYLTNHVGVIDSGFRGEITLKFRETTQRSAGEAGGSVCYVYGKGDRIGQLIIIPYPQIELEEAEELTSTERGAGGYGSTGN
jgi:dUTP pyrophosphatase